MATHRPDGDIHNLITISRIYLPTLKPQAKPCAVFLSNRCALPVPTTGTS
jgi:hypothetical protein